MNKTLKKLLAKLNKVTFEELFYIKKLIPPLGML
jgi:hypothetical protein